MGMDVIGKNPTSETGKYFRRNVWGWRPLADFILDTCPPKITNNCKYWHSNDGDGLNAGNAKALAGCLAIVVDTGMAAKYIAERDARLATLTEKDHETWYDLDIEDIKSFMRFLMDCGGFEIW